MAGQAVFDRRWMFPEKRPSDIGMALKTFLVYVLGINQLVRYGPVTVVAIGALHFAFTNRMMRLPQELRCDGSMTTGADFRLGGLCQVFGVFVMNIVTVGAGKRPDFMFAGVPHGDFALVVAFQTNVVLFLLRFG